LIVIDPANERGTDLEDISATLDEGLRSCRHMVAEYRHLLGSGATVGEIAHAQPANDTGAEHRGG
jgi:hypothetical protein